MSLNLQPINYPSISGFPYKTKVKLHEDEFKAVNLMCWWDKEPKATLHNDPYSSEVYILNGGLTLNMGGSNVSLANGDIYRIMNWQFYSVCKILPETVTLEVLTKDLGDREWGYLVDNEYRPYRNDEYSNNRYRKANPLRFQEGDQRFMKPAKVALNVLRNYSGPLYDLLEAENIPADWLTDF